jgi:hypothetical protein
MLNNNRIKAKEATSPGTFRRIGINRIQKKNKLPAPYLMRPTVNVAVKIHNKVRTTNRIKIRSITYPMRTATPKPCDALSDVDRFMNLIEGNYFHTFFQTRIMFPP